MKIKSCIAVAGVAASLAVEAKTVAIAEIGIRSEKDLSVFEAAVKEAGHEVRKITGSRDLLEKPDTYEGADVVVLTGGWNDGHFPTVGACRQLVRFAARGGGVFLGAFRGGAVRTGGFAPFPEIARCLSGGLPRSARSRCTRWPLSSSSNVLTDLLLS